MKNQRYKRTENRFDDDTVNPMEYVGNLVDAMLVLAVGIMLALVINWNVDIFSSQNNASNTDTQSTVSFSENELKKTDEEKTPDELEKMGTVYYDSETQTYYIIKGDD
ncbi:MAG: DUF2149 domain-containing protein [Clostridiales bacterium]|nr:DUF2149 domain-containing protein [Clostridiales bacterium]